MKRELAAVVLLGGLLGGGWLGYEALFGARTADGLLVVQVEGQVDHVVAGRHDLAATGDYVRSGERLEAGEDGTAVLSFGPDTRVTLRSRSSVQVTGVTTDGVRLDLDGGRVQATVREGGVPVAIGAGGGRTVTARDADVSVARDPDGTVAVEPARGSVGLAGFGVDDVDAGSRVVAPQGEAARVVVARQALLLELAANVPPRTRDTVVEVAGTTEPGAQVRISGGARTVETRADGEGAFRARVTLAEGRNPLVVTAANALGNGAKVAWEVERDTTAPGIQVEIH